MKILQKRQSSKGVSKLRSLPEVFKKIHGVRLFTVVGQLFTLAEIKKMDIFHLVLLYKLHFKNTKFQVFMFCRGLHFSLQKSKESHC